MATPGDPTVPETTLVDTRYVWCDGAGDIRGGENYRPAALGHPSEATVRRRKGAEPVHFGDPRLS